MQKDLLTGVVEITVVVPAFNESARVSRTLKEIVTYLENLRRDYEVIVVDDGSSDGTSQVVLELIHANPRIRLLTLAHQGKGGAVKSGVLAATGELVLFCDADGATPIAELEQLEKAISSGADVAIGSRAISSDEVKVTKRLHRHCIGRVFNTIANLLLVPGFADTQCGFKLFRLQAARAIFALLQENGFIFDVEILFLARKLKLRVVEIAVNWCDQPGSKVELLKDPWRMLFGMLRIRFRNYRVN